MGVMDKMREFKSRPKFTGNNSKTMGIYHEWKSGKNTVRLVGEFIETKTHFIAPSAKLGAKGLCPESAFDKKPDGKSALQKVINCPDWDINKEEWKKEKTCPICQIHETTKLALKDNPTEEESVELKELSNATKPRSAFKWNIFYREDPYVTVTENGKDTKKIGLKIANFGSEVFTAVEAVFSQCKFDLSDADEGIDIEVEKVDGKPVKYKAGACLEGRGLKVTPLTEEERACKPYDLKQICGKQTDVDLLRKSLFEEYRLLLELNAPAPAPAPAVETAPAKKKVNHAVTDDEEAPVSKKK